MPGSQPYENPFEEPIDPIDHFVISCTKTAGYLCQVIPENVYECEECKDPLNNAFISGHGFAEGKIHYFECSKCGKSLMKTRPIFDCQECLIARQNLLEKLERRGITRKNIRRIVYDVEANDFAVLTYAEPPNYEVRHGVSRMRLRHERHRQALLRNLRR